MTRISASCDLKVRMVRLDKWWGIGGIKSVFSVIYAALLAAQPVLGVEGPIAAPPDPAPAVPDCCVIKALTPVRLAITLPIASDTASTGQLFAFTLSAPILLDGGHSIPAGTPGQGEVVHAAHSGMAGKAGELVLAARFLDFQGSRIPLRSMRFGNAGKDKTGTANAIAIGTAVVAPLAGVFALAITGGEVRIPAGAIADAKISADTRIDAAQLALPAVTSSTSEGNVQ